MLAEVVEGDAGVQLGDDELARGAGDEHLAAVRGRADARGAMDVDADVVVGRTSASPVCTPMRTRRSTPSGQGWTASVC